jgi:hypothetical protein
MDFKGLWKKEFLLIFLLACQNQNAALVKKFSGLSDLLDAWKR